MNGRTGRGRTNGARSGQALIELTVALVAVIVVVSALIQIARLGRVQIDTLNEARASAAGMMMGDQYLSTPPNAHYLADWDRGADDAPYSADDQRIGASDQAMRQTIFRVARPSDLGAEVPGNAFTTAMNANPLIDEFRIVHANARSRPVVLFPVVRHLLYNTDEIRLESDVYMVWTKGIY